MAVILIVCGIAVVVLYLVCSLLLTQGSNDINRMAGV
jgi:phage shock protein PspC (stress-responsive transcriptional regulator)